MTTLLAALALVLQDDAPLPNIAEVESAFGGVRLIDARGVGRTPERVGRRAENLDVRDGDFVTTGEGAQVVIVFPDRSRLTLMEKSEIQIRQESSTRRVSLRFGDLMAEVESRRAVRTEFETPVGCVDAAGAVVRMTVGSVTLKLQTIDGVARFRNEKLATTFEVARRQALRVVGEPLVVEVDADGGGELAGRIGGNSVRLTLGDRLIVREPKGESSSVRVDVDTGPVEVDGRAVADSFVAAPESGSPIPGGSEALPAETPETTVADADSVPAPRPVRKARVVPFLYRSAFGDFDRSDVDALGTRRSVRREAEPPAETETAPPPTADVPPPAAEVPPPAAETPQPTAEAPLPGTEAPPSAIETPPSAVEKPAKPRPSLVYDPFTGGFIRRGRRVAPPGALPGINAFRMK